MDATVWLINKGTQNTVGGIGVRAYGYSGHNLCESEDGGLCRCVVFSCVVCGDGGTYVSMVFE